MRLSGSVAKCTPVEFAGDSRWGRPDLLQLDKRPFIVVADEVQVSDPKERLHLGPVARDGHSCAETASIFVQLHLGANE